MDQQNEDDISPPPQWGFSPAEQYLIRHWDSASTLSAEEQRRKLIHAFLLVEGSELDELTTPSSGVLPRTPTADEVRDVLEPWRPTKLRQIAAQLLDYWDPDQVILRTDYAHPNGDEKMEDWIELQELEDVYFDEESLWWRILDDQALFNFGEAWDKVLDLLPELVGRFGEGKLKRGLERHGKLDDDEKTEDRIQWASYCGPAPILIADAESFDTDSLRVIFPDTYGNTIRHSRIEPADIGMLKLMPERGQTVDSTWWANAEIGEKYKAGGEMALKLYPTTEEEQ
ncbi:hypothetical protein B0T10DRAFT_606336 [Thelonectria olida]|uniref:Uncharacterized protein n=1 Tax=Thelonectria olida TaxID=1576542 RepID=A0A9P8W4X0_9HYPO|nr:hypothetical protein B0T10DRAFT_606336 [Thelonectria olida]